MGRQSRRKQTAKLVLQASPPNMPDPNKIASKIKPFLKRACSVCGAPTRHLGFFRPDDQASFGVEPEKTRLLLYELCDPCMAKLPENANEIEEKLLNDRQGKSIHRIPCGKGCDVIIYHDGEAPKERDMGKIELTAEESEHLHDMLRTQAGEQLKIVDEITRLISVEIDKEDQTPASEGWQPAEVSELYHRWYVAIEKAKALVRLVIKTAN